VPWKKAPQLEGTVVDIDGPYMEKRKGLWLWATLAALLKATFLGFLLMGRGMEVPVRYLRVEEFGTGLHRGVKMKGEPTAMITLGDMVAFWGKWEGGNLHMKKAYNHQTGSEVALK